MKLLLGDIVLFHDKVSIEKEIENFTFLHFCHNIHTTIYSISFKFLQDVRYTVYFNVRYSKA